MSTKPVRATPPSSECVACKDRLGAGELPVDVPEDNGEGKGRVERWCPRCFVGIRALRDARWAAAVRIGQVLAIRCLLCGVASVDFGRKRCGQCQSTKIMMLLPKGTVLKASALRGLAGRAS